MKTYIYRTIFLWLLVSSYLTHSQRRPYKKQQNRNFKVKKIRQKKGRGEFFMFNNFKNFRKRTTRETEFEDFSFNWGNGFNTALNNQILLRLARKKAKRVWFKRQKKRVRENIEKKLGRNFDNYDQAKEALFLFSEKENIYRNSKPPINKYQSLRSDGYAISKGYLKELKLLQLRKIEISAGNIHNPKYGYLKANGMLLKDIKDLNTLNQKWDNIVIPLGSNINNTHYNTSIYQKLNNLGADFNKQIIALKNNYYNRFNQWERLNLMQLLLNFEEYKRLSSCGVCLIPSSFYKFKKLDKATSAVIENYAKNNRSVGRSVFNSYYDYRAVYALWRAREGRQEAIYQANKWKVARQNAINKLVNEVHTARFAAENLIAELNITNNSQKNWLYSSSNSNEVRNLSDFLQNNRVHGVVAVEVMNFAKEAVDAICNGGGVDYEELYISVPTPDDNYVYQDPKENIPNRLTLSNGDIVNVTFVTHTSDNKSSNQKVAVELVNSMKFALEQANNNLSLANKITSINVYATTNGHGTTGNSNHLKATAVDINSINGKRMALTGLTNQIIELQKAFDNFQYIRENFGPFFKHKFSKENPIGSQWNYNYPVSGHKDHIHISIRK